MQFEGLDGIETDQVGGGTDTRSSDSLGPLAPTAPPATVRRVPFDPRATGESTTISFFASSAAAPNALSFSGPTLPRVVVARHPLGGGGLLGCGRRDTARMHGRQDITGQFYEERRRVRCNDLLGRAVTGLESG